MDMEDVREARYRVFTARVHIFGIICAVHEGYYKSVCQDECWQVDRGPIWYCHINWDIAYKVLSCNIYRYIGIYRCKAAEKWVLQFAYPTANTPANLCTTTLSSDRAVTATRYIPDAAENPLKIYLWPFPTCTTNRPMQLDSFEYEIMTCHLSELGVVRYPRL